MKPIQIKEEWINKLIETKSPSKVARYFNKDRSNIYKYFKRLLREGTLGKKGGYWFINDYDKLMIELHAFQATISIYGFDEKILDLLKIRNEIKTHWLNDKIKPVQYFMEFKEIPQFIIKIVSDTLIFIQKKETPLRLPRNMEAIDRLNEIIQKEVKGKFDFLEKKLNIKILDFEDLKLNVTENHYSFISDQIAKKFVKDKEKLKVYINNELRTVIDLSKGKSKPELEEVNTQYARTDAKAWEKLVSKVNTGEFDVDKVNENFSNIYKITEIQTKEYAENIRLHLDTLRQIQIAIRELRDEIKKR